MRRCEIRASIELDHLRRDGHVEPGERSAEALVLERLPGLRRTVVESTAFTEWCKSLTALEVDGETLYLRAGDSLRDREQIIFEWARRNGLLTDEMIREHAGAGTKPLER
jgi:hypothetical protein